MSYSTLLIPILSKLLLTISFILLGLVNVANSKYKFVLYEEPQLLDEEISINKRELIDQLLNFLTISNSINFNNLFSLVLK